jgi:hypothetical protein
MRNSCFIVTPFDGEILFESPDVGVGVEAGVPDPHGFLNMPGLMGILHPIPPHAEAVCDLSNAAKRVSHVFSFWFIRPLVYMLAARFFFTQVEESFPGPKTQRRQSKRGQAGRAKISLWRRTFA